MASAVMNGTAPQVPLARDLANTPPGHLNARDIAAKALR